MVAITNMRGSALPTHITPYNTALDHSTKKISVLRQAATNLDNQDSNTPRIPYENNLANNFLWQTTSKALLKSM